MLEPMPPCLQPWQLWQLEANKLALLMALECHWLQALVPQKRQSVSSVCDALPWQHLAFLCRPSPQRVGGQQKAAGARKRLTRRPLSSL